MKRRKYNKTINKEEEYEKKWLKYKINIFLKYIFKIPLELANIISSYLGNDTVLSYHIFKNKSNEIKNNSVKLKKKFKKL